MTKPLVAIAFAVVLACTAFACTRPQPPGGGLDRGLAEVAK